MSRPRNFSLTLTNGVNSLRVENRIYQHGLIKFSSYCVCRLEALMTNPIGDPFLRPAKQKNPSARSNCKPRHTPPKKAEKTFRDPKFVEIIHKKSTN